VAVDETVRAVPIALLAVALGQNELLVRFQERNSVDLAEVPFQVVIEGWFGRMCGSIHGGSIQA